MKLWVCLGIAAIFSSAQSSQITTPAVFKDQKAQYLDIQKQIGDKKVYLYHLGVFLNDPVYAIGVHAEKLRISLAEASNAMISLANANNPIESLAHSAQIELAERDFIKIKGLAWQLLDKHSSPPFFSDSKSAFAKLKTVLEELKNLQAKKKELFSLKPELKEIGKNVRQQLIILTDQVISRLKTVAASEMNLTLKDREDTAIKALETLKAAATAFHYKAYIEESQKPESRILALTATPHNTHQEEYQALKNKVKGIRFQLREVHNRLGLPYISPAHENVVFRLYDLQRRLGKRPITADTNVHLANAKNQIDAAERIIKELTTVPDTQSVTNHTPLSDAEKKALQAKMNDLLKQFKVAKAKLQEFKLKQAIEKRPNSDAKKISVAKQHITEAASELKKYKETARSLAEKIDSQVLVTEITQIATLAPSELPAAVNEEFVAPVTQETRPVLHSESDLEKQYKTVKSKIVEIREKLHDLIKTRGYNLPDMTPKHFKLFLHLHSVRLLVEKYADRLKDARIKSITKEYAKLEKIVMKLLNIPAVITSHTKPEHGQRSHTEAEAKKLLKEYKAAKKESKDLRQRLITQGKITHKVGMEEADIMEAKRLVAHIVELVKQYKKSVGGRLPAIEAQALEHELQMVEEKVNTQLSKAVETEANEIVKTPAFTPPPKPSVLKPDDSVKTLLAQIKTAKNSISGIQKQIDAHFVGMGKIPELGRIQTAISLGRQAAGQLKDILAQMTGMEHYEQAKRYEQNLIKSLDILTKQATLLEAKEKSILRPAESIIKDHHNQIDALQQKKTASIAVLHNLLHRLLELRAHSEFVTPTNAESSIQSICDVADFLRKLAQLHGPADKRLKMLQVGRLVEDASRELHDCPDANALPAAVSAPSPAATGADATVHRLAIANDKGELLHLQQGSELKEFVKELDIYKNLVSIVEVISKAKDTKKMHHLYVEKELDDLLVQLNKDLLKMSELIVPPVEFAKDHKVTRSVVEIESSLSQHRANLYAILSTQPGHQDAERQLLTIRSSLTSAKALLEKLESVEASPAIKEEEKGAIKKIDKAIKDVNGITNRDIEDHARNVPASDPLIKIPNAPSNNPISTAPSSHKTKDELKKEYHEEKSKLDKMVKEYRQEKESFCAEAGPQHPKCTPKTTTELLEKAKKIHDQIKADVKLNPNASNVAQKKASLETLEKTIAEMTKTDPEARAEQKNKMIHKYNASLTTKKKDIHNQRIKVDSLGAQLDLPVSTFHHMNKLDKITKQISDAYKNDPQGGKLHSALNDLRSNLQASPPAVEKSNEVLRQYAKSLADNLLHKVEMQKHLNPAEHRHSIWDMVVDHLNESKHAHKDEALKMAQQKKSKAAA